MLPPKRRPGAELLAWSAVHGLAVLIIDGPLRGLADPRTQTIEQRLLDMHVTGAIDAGSPSNPLQHVRNLR